MVDKSSRIQRKLSQGFGAVAVAGIIVSGISLGLAYRQEMIQRECCSTPPWGVPLGLIFKQQKIFSEYGRFASSVEELETFSAYRIHPEMKKRYDYSIENHPNRSIIRALSTLGRVSYIGQVTIIPNPKPGEYPIISILCESKGPAIGSIDPPIDSNNCAKGTFKRHPR
jgi:hypothetical protein